MSPETDTVTAEQEKDAESVLRLRLEQADELERMVLRQQGEARAVKERVEEGLRVDLARVLDRLPWKETPAGEVVDRRQLGRIRKVRREAFRIVNRARDTLARELLPRAAQ